MSNIIHSRHFTNYIVILIGFLIAGISLFYNFIINEGFSIDGYRIGTGIVQLAGMYLLIKSGTFIKTRFSKYARIGIAFILTGVLFKVLHYYGSEIAIITGCAVILGFYTWSFIDKPLKKVLDWLKLLFAFVTLTTYISSVFHYTWGDYLPAPIVIMFFMIILHIDEQKKLDFPEEINDTFNL